MSTETINIQGTDYKIGFSFRAIREFEELTKRSITNANSTYDNLLFFYSTLKALNKDFQMNLEQFIDEMDKRPDLLIQFQTTQTEAQQAETDQPDNKKKATLRETFMLWMLSLLLLVLPVWLPVISGIFAVLLSLKLLVKLIASLGKKRGSP
ncbi:hypothetical protein [Sunxiuqinia indica]|uniref:hypothetical protein n=1 Tax=Sunxiuqinia indica TaxID=2692584 RepID=UPI00135BFADA|nr:hypothetical protein [Sunxiuqinia indica]